MASEWIVAQIHDANGAVVSGAKCTVFAGGTTTLATICSDVDLTTPTTNPVVADSSGRFNFYVSTANNATYDYKVTDNAGGTTYHYPKNVPATNANTRFIVRMDDASTIADISDEIETVAGLESALDVAEDREAALITIQDNPDTFTHIGDNQSAYVWLNDSGNQSSVEDAEANATTATTKAAEALSSANDAATSESNVSNKQNDALFQGYGPNDRDLRSVIRSPNGQSMVASGVAGAGFTIPGTAGNEPSVQGHALINRDAAIVGSIDHMGGHNYISAVAQPSVWQDGTNLIAFHSGQKITVCSLGSTTLVGWFPVSPTGVVVTLTTSTTTTRRFVDIYQGDLIHYDPNAVYMMIVYGQSLSRGEDGTPLITSQVSTNEEMLALMPESGIDFGLASVGTVGTLTTNNFDKLVPLRATSNSASSGDDGETIAPGIAHKLNKIALESGAPWQTVWIAPGFGGKKLSQLDYFNTNLEPFQNMLKAIEMVRDIVAKQGKKLVIPGVAWVQGESDDNTSISSYKDNFTRMQTDLQTEVESRLSHHADLEPIKWFLHQPSSFRTDAGYGLAVQALQELADEEDNTYLLDPDYARLEEYQSGKLHGTGLFYHLKGEAHAATIRKALWSYDEPDDFKITAATMADQGSVITVTATSDYMPIQLKTDPIAEKNVEGFQVDVNGSFVTVNSVVIADADAGTLTLTLASSIPSGATVKIYYAFDGHQSSSFTDATIPRGNLFDSRGTTWKSSQDGRRLDAGCRHQIFTVTVT